MSCKDCGGTMIGDGYTLVEYCEFVGEDVDTSYMAPDEGPIYCGFSEDESSLTEDAALAAASMEE